MLHHGRHFALHLVLLRVVNIFGLFLQDVQELTRLNVFQEYERRGCNFAVLLVQIQAAHLHELEQGAWAIPVCDKGKSVRSAGLLGNQAQFGCTYAHRLGLLRNTLI